MLTEQMIINSSKFQDSNSLEINDDSFLSMGQPKKGSDVTADAVRDNHRVAAAVGDNRD